MPPSDNASAELSASGSEAEFDVFLSHNSRDKPLVRELYKTLIAYDLRPWLDEEELVPGRAWQDALEQIITTTKTAAVLYGPTGLGPWEEPEMRACLNQFVRRKLSVIPVLLPGAPKEPDLPLFLQAFTWVDLRDGLTDEGIEKLVWGITGEKPEVLPPKKIAPAAAGPLAARLRARYGQRVGNKWDVRWSQGTDATDEQEDLPPFIAQGIRLLKEIEDPRACLRPEYFRAGRVARSGGEPTEQHPDAWVGVERSEFAHNALQTEDGEPCDLSRLVITTDAGVGKTTMMEWLEVELNRDGVYWRNRTLQEFFTAYWLAQFCQDQDVAQWGQRLYCADRPETEAYYWVWRFLCEMPDAARNPRRWSKAIEPIFRPGDGTVSGTCRSSEMIYRAWPGLTELVRRRIDAAKRVQAAFLGEFEREILSGRRGEVAQRTARQFCA